MRVSCNRLKLAEAFGIVSALAVKGHSREALQCVKMDVQENGLCTLSATNMDTSIRLELDGATPLGNTPQKKTTGAALLNVARVGQIIRETTDEELQFANDGEQILISGKSSSFRLNSIDPKEFPDSTAWPEQANDGYIELQSRWLAESIKRTAFATDPDSTRFALGGVLFEADPETSELKLVGTDGRRLAYVVGKGKMVGNVPTYGSIVPTAALNLIARSLTRAETVKMAIVGNNAVFAVGGTTISTRLVDGRFPNWRQVLPSRENHNKISMSVGPFHGVIRQAAIVADTESRGLDFDFTPGTLLLTAQTAELGRSHVELPIGYEGDRFLMRMDYRFVTDFLKALDASQQFTLDVVSSTASALLTTDDGYSYVVMPMALDK
jgi:DNA polymerase III subunit beta